MFSRRGDWLNARASGCRIHSLSHTPPKAASFEHHCGPGPLKGFGPWVGLACWPVGPGLAQWAGPGLRDTRPEAARRDACPGAPLQGGSPRWVSWRSPPGGPAGMVVRAPPSRGARRDGCPGAPLGGSAGEGCLGGTLEGSWLALRQSAHPVRLWV